MMKTLRQLLTLMLLFNATQLIAQQNSNEFVEDKPVLMKNEATGGLNFHTSGTIGIQFRKGYNLTGFKKWILEGDLA